MPKKIYCPSSSDEGPKAGVGGEAISVWLGFKNPSFLISSLAINWLALSEGWYSSQNTYLLLSLHNIDAGLHVNAGLIFPNEQHGESELLKPAIFTLNLTYVRN